VNGNSAFCNGNSFFLVTVGGPKLPWPFMMGLPIVVGPAGDAAQ
jgi:hypothetical protein